MIKKVRLEEVELKSAVYPALLSIVGNRYYIIVGLFVYYGFILAYGLIDKYISSFGNFWISLVFMIFIFHNITNYCLNNIRECQITRKKFLRRYMIMEIIFVVLSLAMLVGAHVLFFGIDRLIGWLFAISISLLSIGSFVLIKWYYS